MYCKEYFIVGPNHNLTLPHQRTSGHVRKAVEFDRYGYIDTDKNGSSYFLAIPIFGCSSLSILINLLHFIYRYTNTYSNMERIVAQSIPDEISNFCWFFFSLMEMEYSMANTWCQEGVQFNQKLRLKWFQSTLNKIYSQALTKLNNNWIWKVKLSTYVLSVGVKFVQKCTLC